MKRIMTLGLIFGMLLAMGIGMSGCGEKKGEPVTITIAAAASLENAFTQELIPTFEKQNPGIKVAGTYDASGKLQKQIEEGATVDIFFSAATKQMNELIDKELVDKKESTDLVENELVLIRGKDVKVDNVKEFKDIINGKTIALGDPASVPAGQYAETAFTNLGILDKVKAMDVSYGTNVVEVLNWVAEGSADLGVVYKSDAKSMSDKVEIVATAPSTAVANPVYPIGVIKASKNQETAKKFIEFLKGEEAGKIFEKYGFSPKK